MVAGHVGALEVKAGRGDEFLAVVAAQKTWSEGHGAVAWARRTLIAGPESGRISITALFEDTAARAAYFDAIAEDIANGPINQMVNSADPPATSISRAFFDEIGESSGIPDNPPLQMTLVFAEGTGQTAEALSTLQATKERWAEVGVPSWTFRTLFGGSATGRLIRASAFDGWAALEAAGAAYLALGPTPTIAAAASGALTRLSQSVSVRIDL